MDLPAELLANALEQPKGPDRPHGASCGVRAPSTYAVEMLLKAVHGGVGTEPGQVSRFPLPLISRGSVAARPV